MNTTDLHKAVNQTLDTYRDILDTVSDEQFAQSPPDGSWSIAEVYSHVLQSTLGASIAVERCINGTCDITNKGLNLMGRFVLFFQRFPLKVKTPAAIASKIPAVKISKEEARNLIIKCRQRIETITPRMAEDSGMHKISHSILGMLNGKQWFKFALIHLKHHLRQISRLKK